MEPTSDAWESAFTTEQPSLVRPYTLTAGRTTTEVELPMEAPIFPLAAAPAALWPGNDVRGEILKLGSTRPSVAEVAAKLAIPLGVARVLIGDLVQGPAEQTVGGCRLERDQDRAGVPTRDDPPAGGLEEGDPAAVEHLFAVWMLDGQPSTKLESEHRVRRRENQGWRSRRRWVRHVVLDLHRAHVVERGQDGGGVPHAPARGLDGAADADHGTHWPGEHTSASRP